jgi:Nif-specific regulatory protein
MYLGVRDLSDLGDLGRDRMNSLISIASALLLQKLRLLGLIDDGLSSLQMDPREESVSNLRPVNMVGNAKAMQVVYEHISQVAASDTSVLISGASGVGKELVANAIHINSLRAAKPFIKVNCAALPETLLESELFGHEHGSFTGAIQQKKGRFELANGGTLFLDEVGDFSPATQVKLLRVLQEKEFERLGGTVTLRTNVRIIAATNRDLQDLIAEGKFRQDLYYRLNVFPIFVPPLRDRKADILLLADHFVEKYNRLLRKNVRRMSTPAIDMLMSYHWPGNVRELENCIERAVLLSKDDVLHGHQLPSSLQTAEASDTLRTGTLQGALGALEREMLIDALKNSHGNLAQAARDLGLSERKIGLRVKKYKIDSRCFRQPSAN